MRRLPTALEELEIAAPCAASWDAMRGDAQRRHCARCDRDVVNVAGFTRWEAEELLLAFRERHCLRIARLEDGTVVTDGLLPAARCRRGRGLRQRVVRAAGALVAGASLGLLVWRARLPEPAEVTPSHPKHTQAPEGDPRDQEAGAIVLTEDDWAALELETIGVTR